MSNRKITMASLRKFNLIMGFLHLFQALTIFFLSKNFSLPISGSFLAFDKGSQELLPATRVLFDVSLPLLIVSFLAMSAAAHFIIATVYSKTYAKTLELGINRARWIEYSISAGIMMIAIGLLVGIYDAMSLVMLFALVAFMNLAGLIMEVHNQTVAKTNWLSYWIGCLAGIVPWIVVAFYLWLGADSGSKAPTFVYWIFVSIFILFNCFAINMFLQYKKVGPWRDYLYGERAYIILSLVAKSLLAWQVFAGTLRP